MNGFGFCQRSGQRADEERTSGVKSDALALAFGRRMAEAIIPDRPHATRQDMTQISPNKLHPADGVDSFRIVVGTVRPAEGDVVAIDANDPRVADGGAADVCSEIFDGTLAGAKRLEMHAPFLAPDPVINWWQCYLFAQGRDFIAETGSEDLHQGLLLHQVFLTFDGDHISVRIDARARHDAVDVRMEKEPLVPGVQDHGETAGFGTEPAGIGQRV